MHDAHDALTGRHRGMNATLEKVERYFYWPKLRKDVFNYVARVPSVKRSRYLMVSSKVC